MKDAPRDYETELIVKKKESKWEKFKPHLKWILPLSSIVIKRWFKKKK